jgi:hypothetical protein
MKQINIPPIRIPEFRMPSLGLSAIGLPADRSGNRLAWPSGLKYSIVCWYSPRKQGLTEYDVIESYAEDFTTWDKFPNRGTVTVTQNTILITESKELYNIIEDKQEPYSDLTINITGVSDDLFLIVSDNTGRKGEIKKDGIYTFKNNSRYFGFKTNAVGECNIKITQLPTSKAKDFSANGHDLFLYKFKGKLDSGIGLYHADFTEWTNSNSDEVSPEQVVFTTAGVKNITLYGTKSNSINVQVKGFSDKVKYLRLGYIDNGTSKEINVFKDGIYTIPGSESETSGVASKISISLKEDSKVTVTQIPDYPNQLCYNGSSYGVAYGLPILSDYTIIADRTWFENDGNRVFANKGNIWPNCAFTFEKINVSLNSETFSFSKATGIDDLRNKSGITYQTKQSYNGNPISFGDSSDGEVLAIGGQITGEFVGCHGDILLFNRTLTDDEITWLKENWEKL